MFINCLAYSMVFSFLKKEKEILVRQWSRITEPIYAFRVSKTKWPHSGLIDQLKWQR